MKTRCGFEGKLRAAVAICLDCQLGTRMEWKRSQEAVQRRMLVRLVWGMNG